MYNQIRLDLLPLLRGYFLLMTVGFTVYMVREVRQYGRWLRDNYADLEHKEGKFRKISYLCTQVCQGPVPLAGSVCQ